MTSPSSASRPTSRDKASTIPAAGVLGLEPFRGDVLLHKGLDDRTGSHGVLELAQALAADAFGADESFFSTNGSTLSVQAAVLAAAGPGEKILIQRNAHKSAVAGVILSGAMPVWVVPDLRVPPARDSPPHG